MQAFFSGHYMKKLEIKPNFIDKAFSYFAPVHGLRRLEARTQMAMVGDIPEQGLTGGKQKLGGQLTALRTM